MAAAVHRDETRQAVAALTTEGLSARQIAQRLGIASRTVTRWRARIADTTAVTPEPTPPTAWQTRAACLGTDPSLFIPDDHAPSHSYARGRAVCMGCPARQACLDDAMAREGRAAARYRAGLWGGLSPEQRANLAAVRSGRPAVVRDREAEAQARRRDELLAGLRESA